MELEGGRIATTKVVATEPAITVRTAFFEKEETVNSVDEKLKGELSNVKSAIYNKIVIGSLPNDSKIPQKTENAIYYEYVMRRLCLDLDPSINLSNIVPFDELPQINKLISQLKKDPEIEPLINSLIQTYRSLAKSENAIYNNRFIQEALIVFPWPYETDEF